MGMQNNAVKQNIEGVEVLKDKAFDIPVIYIEPAEPAEKRKLAIFLSGLTGTKESLATYLKDIAAKGYVALAFDLYQHGERGTETQQELGSRVFSNMRKHGWKVLGQTALDTKRVIDWAIDNLGVIPEIHMGGISMGGDISIAAAGIDPRIVRIAPIITTPDWMRPGMHNLWNPEKLMDPGEPDAEAQSYYDRLNPTTHLGHYVDCPPMRLTLGEEDSHIPPENAERFKAELAKISPKAAERIQIVYIPGPNANHGDVMQRQGEWWADMLEWWL